MESLFDRAGGALKVRSIIDDFVDRMVGDLMIGFFFAGVDRDTLARREFEFTARFLGAQGIPYTGRPLRAAHAGRRIMGGQFARRKQLLAQTLQDHGVRRDVAEAWLAHVESLRDHVTSDAPGECD